MRDFRILGLLIICVAILYIGVEPYAHTKLHPQVAPADYNFANEDLALAASDVKAAEEAVKKAEETYKKKSNSDNEAALNGAKATLEEKKAFQDKYTIFWNDINKIDFAKGDPVRGAETFMNAGCIGCHGVKAAGFEAPMDENLSTEAYGVNPPDLSLAGRIYDEKFLAALIIDPTMALKLTHKFGDERPFPMTQFFGVGGDIHEEVADIVAYLKSIAQTNEQLVAEQKALLGIKDEVRLTKAQQDFLSSRAVFSAACQRCHDVKYDKISSEGSKELVAAYMGSTPPDLSMMIRSKSKSYLHEFMNDTQKMLPGTSMPRVGLTKLAEDEVVAYLEAVGDSKKKERQSVSINIMIFFAIMSVFAYLWKQYIWRNLH